MKFKRLINITDKIRSYTPYDPPQPRNTLLPPNFNIILSASPKGGGKTYNCIQLLTNYEDSGFVSSKGEDVKMRTVWISGGTSRSKQNSILDSLKKRGGVLDPLFSFSLSFSGVGWGCPIPQENSLKP